MNSDTETMSPAVSAAPWKQQLFLGSYLAACAVAMLGWLAALGWAATALVGWLFF
jgi:hypothetical protein